MQKDKIIELRARVVLLKPKLTSIKGWKGKFINKFPEYDNLYGIGLLNNVIACRSTDEALIDKLDQLVQENEMQHVTK